MSKLRILIADDHPLVRKGMSTILAGEPDFEVVGQATDGAEAIELAAQLQPDLILMDLQMPNVTGVTATREILNSNPDIRILVVTLFEDDDSVFLALRAGARGYVLKDADEEDLIQAIRAVAGGAAIFSQSIANHVLTTFSKDQRPDTAVVFPELTQRERDILELIAQGYPNPRIAFQLGLSPKTVGNYVSTIFAKLRVADRADAIIRARDAGMGESRRESHASGCLS
jgi:DNA-binding NarL/FixJ family response regulator